MDASFINHVFTISWLPYPWQQRTAMVVKDRITRWWSIKGLVSDKIACGRTGDFRSVENRLFCGAGWHHCTMQKHMELPFPISAQTMELGVTRTKSLLMCFQSDHKKAAAHERQTFQPLTCSFLSHTGCLPRKENVFQTESTFKTTFPFLFFILLIAKAPGCALWKFFLLICLLKSFHPYRITRIPPLWGPPLSFSEWLHLMELMAYER